MSGDPAKLGPTSAEAIPSRALRPAISVENSNGIRTSTVEVIRDAQEGHKFNFTLRRVEIGRDEDGDSISACVIEPSVSPDTPGKAADHRTRFGWIYSFYVGPQNDSKPLSPRRIADKSAEHKAKEIESNES